MGTISPINLRPTQCCPEGDGGNCPSAKAWPITSYLFTFYSVCDSTAVVISSGVRVSNPTNIVLYLDINKIRSLPFPF